MKVDSSNSDSEIDSSEAETSSEADTETSTNSNSIQVKVCGKTNNPGKAFSEKYKDPVFRAAHLQYVSEKEICECGQLVSRSNKAKHQRTPLHSKRIAQQELKKKTITIDVDEDVIKKIERMVLDLQEKINTLILVKNI